ncbi:hypothetical protein [Bacillus sp. AG4(2022)]|uniref:hypothetical protein n=1 Tax=Bacillus sp. AG4(2022) TaxID=2962594 RepID=UPI002881AB18|nr:hypothetical protein [Bacillus sp. AG4(2022)]MDT0161607.1 hypothetical protein [Bacillus sp. AG4(2022)]
MLDISVTYVPINKITCVFTGLFFIALMSLFYILIIYIRNEQNFKKRIGIIFVSILFLLTVHIALSIILVSPAMNTIHINILKLSILWLLPLVMALVFAFTNFIAMNFIKVAFSVVLSALTILFINNHIMTMPLEVLISLIIFTTAILLMIFKFVNNQPLFIWGFGFIVSYVFVEGFFAFYLISYSNWIILLLSILIFSTLIGYLLYKLFNTDGKEDSKIKEAINPPQRSKKNPFDLIKVIVLISSLLILVILPLIGLTLFTLGDYVGDTLDQAGLISYEEINFVDYETVTGKVVSTDSNNIYVSQKNRTLRVIKLPHTLVEWDSRSGF